jgi:hypothetical protein
MGPNLRHKTLITFSVVVAFSLCSGMATLAGPYDPQLASKIDSYLSTKKSPIARNGSVFVAAGLKYQVDPRLIVAIAGQESTFGTRWSACPPSGFNAWSWFYYGNGDCPHSSFSSFADGIQNDQHGVTRGIRLLYLNQGLTTIAKIQPTYCASGCGDWVQNVTRFYTDLGGDVNDLTYFAPPPPPTATAATNVTSRSFQANWNGSTGATGYKLELSVFSNFSNFSTVDVGDALNRTVTGLSANTTYYYRVRAYNPAFTSGTVNSISVTTSKLSVAQAPSNVSVITVSNSSLRVNFKDNAVDESNILIERKTGSTGPWALLGGFGVLSGTAIWNWTNTGLASGRIYCYRLRAQNTAGYSPYSNEACGTTLR